MAGEGAEVVLVWELEPGALLGGWGGIAVVASSSQSLLPGAPWIFGMHQMCGIIVSINPALHPHGWALPSSPQPHNSQVINTQISSENLWKRAGQQPQLGLDLFSPSHSRNRSSSCDLSDLKGSQRLPWNSRTEGAQSGSGRMFWKSSKGGVWGGLGGSCG